MERRSEGERDEMKLEMLLLLLCAKRQTDADARNFYGFNPPGARRASEGGKKENAYGSINAFIWPPSLLPSAPCLIPSLRSGWKKLFVVLRILRRKLHSLCSPALMDPCATDDGCAIKPRSVNDSKMRSKSVLARLPILAAC